LHDVVNLPGIASERLVALFILGVLLFSPPFLLIFDNSATLMGIPVLYLYLFVAWAALIGLLALAIEKMEDGEHVTPRAKVAAGKPENMVPEANGKD
jgi:hypothetical protein